MKKYNKLVRDNIPDIIKSNGEVPIITILKDKEYINQLNKKLLEEVNEYITSGLTEELADIVEVIYGILDYNNISISEFEKIRKEKETKNGAFKKKIFLKNVLKK